MENIFVIFFRLENGRNVYIFPTLMQKQKMMYYYLGTNYLGLEGTYQKLT